jgi:hypothetical protein
MEHITRPSRWPELSEIAFEKFLATCADYRRQSYLGHAKYYYTHNKQSFAVIVNGVLFVHPDVATERAK